MDHVVVAPPAAGSRRAWPARLLPAAQCQLLLLGACQPDPTAPATPDGLTAELAALRTDNGLLYPPELWDVLTPSPRSEALRNQALTALGEPVGWSLAPAPLYQALAGETDDLTAAWLLVGAGLDPPVSPATITAWLQRPQPVSDEVGLDRLWQAVTVATHRGDEIDLSPATVVQARQWLDDPSPLRQLQAVDILLAAGHDRPPLPAAATWLRHLEASEQGHQPQTAARELLAWVMLHRDSPQFNLEPTYWQPLFTLARDNDDTYSYLVQAFAAAGEHAVARQIAAGFDQRRLRDDGSVLEPPRFTGSVGSTFRMLRLLQQAQPGSTALPGAEELESAVRHLLTRDTSHWVAGLATIQLLHGPDAVPRAERQAAIEAAMADTGVVAGQPMALEAAMGWIAVAEYATVLQVPVEFPGLTPQALQDLLDPGELDPDGDGALYAVARLALALLDTGHHDAAVLPVLADHLHTGLASRTPAQTNGLLLFAGSLALLRLERPLPVPAPELAMEIEQRRGDCLGGFHSFIRELRPANTACNVEVTRYAAQVLEAIDAQ